MRFGVSLIEPAHLLAIAIRIGIPLELFVVRWLSLDHIDSRLTASSSEQLRPLIQKFELTFGGLFALALFRPGPTGQQDILERAGAIGQRRRKLPRALAPLGSASYRP